MAGHESAHRGSAPALNGQGWESSPRLLVLHAVRLKGMADESAVARRFSLDHGSVADFLREFEAAGWIRRVGFAGSHGWAMTEAGRRENSRQLAEELRLAGAREVVTEAHAAFLPLNKRFLVACTDWQIRPSRWEPMALNDHTDYRWDERVIDELGSLGRHMQPLCQDLAQALARFTGYPHRFWAALAHVDRGERDWVDGARVDSCHAVWMELHEDLLATLGLERGDEG